MCFLPLPIRLFSDETMGDLPIFRQFCLECLPILPNSCFIGIKRPTIVQCLGRESPIPIKFG